MTTVTPDDALEHFFRDLASATAKREHVHGMHPYPAKFIPHIPRALIAHYTTAGETVLDPMCGSGTTLVEAALMHRRPIGLDVNPVAVLASRAKTAHPTSADELELDLLEEQLRAHLRGAGVAAGRAVRDFPNRDHWFVERVARDLEHVCSLIDSLNSCGARVLARCALSAIIVSVSRQESETRWAARDAVFPPRVVFERMLDKLRDIRARRGAFLAADPTDAVVLRGDARRLPLQSSSVDAVVTSPPYANSHDYYLYHKLRLFWLSESVRTTQDLEFGSRNKHSDKKLDVEHYLDSMRQVFGECARVVRPGGTAAFVVADAVIRGEFFDMRELLDAEAASTGLGRRDYFGFGHKVFTSAFHRKFGTTQPKRTHVLVYTVGERTLRDASTSTG